MKKIIFIALAAMAVGCAPKSPSAQVNVFNGTDFHGHTYPGATVPYGMVQLSPDTRTLTWDGCSGYHYSDKSILGFSHTHLSGTGCADLGDFLFTPGIDQVPDSLSFSHSDEKARPGYYRVDFPAGITAELTATAHAGVQRYTFRKDGMPQIVVNAVHCIGDNVPLVTDLQVKGDRQVDGHRLVNGWIEGRNVYMSAVFSVPFVSAEEIAPGKLLLSFPQGTQEVVVTTGLSVNGTAQALANREAEVGDKYFDDVLAETEAAWAQSLGVIEVSGGPTELFYTQLYHTFTTPNLISDVLQDPFYSTLSLWDTFRSWNPLQTLINPALVSDMVNSMLAMYDAWGELPIWPLFQGETYCMIGYHSIPVIADAWLRGIRGFDGEKALAAMVVSSNRNKGRNTSPLYNAYGYVPADMEPESASQTLEFAYDDWCIARMAESLGHEDIAAEYDVRALRYRNLFDGKTGFMRGRLSNGNWTTPFDPLGSTADYTEAIPWQARFFVPQDPAGHEMLMGGREAMLAALDSLFTYDARSSKVDISDITGLVGQYAHGNEPSQHMAWLFNWYGKPWRSQELVREILTTLYSAAPDGVCGNDDCGQMSAWYVLSSLGIYPACPGSGEYILAAPMFKKAVVHLGSGKELVITADHPENAYIKDITLNGQRVERNFLTYDEIVAGGTLAFTLSATPDHGRDGLPAPYSLTTKPVVSVPFVTEDLTLFKGESQVHLGCRTEGASIHYTLDGSEPTQNSPEYTGPFTIDRSLVLRARAWKEGCEPSTPMLVTAEKAFFRPGLQHVSGLKQGCRYSYYEGEFQRTGDMFATPVVASGVCPQPSLGVAPTPDHYGLVFTGYIDIPEDGVWNFCTISDDGSLLEIDGAVVVNNDTSHSARRQGGRIPLLKGLHPFRLLYFEDYEGEMLAWGWGPEGSSELSPIPTDKLFYR